MHCYDIYVNEDRGAEAGDDASMMGPVIAVMCAVGSSERGSKPQKKKKYLHHHDKCPFPWLNLGLYDFPKVTENTWSHHIRPFMPSLQKAHCDIFP